MYEIVIVKFRCEIIDIHAHAIYPTFDYPKIVDRVKKQQLKLIDNSTYSDNFFHPTYLRDNRYFHYTFLLAIYSYHNRTAIDAHRKLLVKLFSFS